MDILPPWSFFFDRRGALVGVWEIVAAGIPCSCMNSFTICPLLGLIKPYVLARCDQLTFSDGDQPLASSSNLSTAIVSRGRLLEQQPCFRFGAGWSGSASCRFLSGVTRPSILLSLSSVLQLILFVSTTFWLSCSFNSLSWWLVCLCHFRFSLCLLTLVGLWMTLLFGVSTRTSWILFLNVVWATVFSSRRTFRPNFVGVDRSALVKFITGTLVVFLEPGKALTSIGEWFWHALQSDRVWFCFSSSGSCFHL